MNKNTLGRESLIYGVGHIITRMITFLLLPLFTNTLTTYEYGILSLVYTFCGFFTTILHLGLDASLLKHYKPADNKERSIFTTNTYIPLLLVNIVFVFTMVLLKDVLVTPILGINNSLIFILMLLIIAFDGLWSIPMVLLRADNAPFKYLTFTVTNVVSNITFIYFFFIVLQLGIVGIVFSNVLSSCLLFIISSPVVLRKISLSKLKMDVFKKLFKFGSPFIFAGIFSMVIELSDRYIIKYLLNIEMVGVYNAGYKLGMLMLLIVMGFNMAWQPYFLDKKNNDTNILESTTNNVWITFSFLCGAIICFIEPISKINVFGYTLIGSEFTESLVIVPLICLGYLFHGAYILQLPGPFLTGKTYYIALIRGLGAVFNIALNFILIPVYGIEGAAVSTLLSFVIMSIMLLAVNRKIFTLNYNFYGILCTVIILLCYVFVIKTNPDFQVRFIMIIMMPILFFLFGCFDVNQILTNTKYRK